MSEGKNERKAIEIDLDNYLLQVTIPKKRINFTLCFSGSSSRQFYLAVICFVIKEMKARATQIGERVLINSPEIMLLNEKIGYPIGGDLFHCIGQAWRERLNNLERAMHFDIEGRERISLKINDEKYKCSSQEIEFWNNLFEYDGEGENIRLGFAVEKKGIGFDDVLIKYKDKKDIPAWEGFKEELETRPTKVIKVRAVPLSEGQEGKIERMKEGVLEKSEEQRALLNRYVDLVKETHLYLDTAYMGIMPPKPVRLSEIYIESKASQPIPVSEATHLTEQTQYLSGISQSIIKEKRILTQPGYPPRSIEEVVKEAFAERDSSRRHLVFLGPSGSGKTTLLKHLVNLLISEEEQKTGLERPVPFL